jgi:hypothetical protein
MHYAISIYKLYENKFIAESFLHNLPPKEMSSVLAEFFVRLLLGSKGFQGDV